MFIVAPASSGRFMTVPRKKKKKANGPLSFRRYTNPVYWLVQHRGATWIKKPYRGLSPRARVAALFRAKCRVGGRT